VEIKQRADTKRAFSLLSRRERLSMLASFLKQPIDADLTDKEIGRLFFPLLYGPQAEEIRRRIDAALRMAGITPK
jgi:hypothetical protein